MTWTYEMTVIAIASHWAGLVRYLVNRKDKPFEAKLCLRQMIISGFVGFVCSMTADNLNLSGMSNIGLSVLGAYAGAAVLTRLTKKLGL